MFNRIAGVFKLDKNIFEEIKNDHQATIQAAFIVAIVSLISSLGGGINASMLHQSFFIGFFVSLVWFFFGWILWALVSHLVGSTFFGGKGSLSGMLSAIGYAYIPQALGFIPLIGIFIGWIWSLLAGFVAVRQGLGLDNLRAFLTIVIGFIAYIIGYGIIFIFLLPLR
jgi:hypothetical protein